MITYAVVIPTIGRAGLAQLVATVDGQPAPSCIVVADDRRDATSALDLPVTAAPLVVVRTHGRGPAAARNAGWRAADADWIAFLDDDVAIPGDWCRRLVEDLDGLPGNVGASQAWIHVPAPDGRPPTDGERRTMNLSGALWITADMAYRRSALLASGGFDERFPRAFREDADLALRTVRLGYSIVWGERVTTHPLAPSAGWRSSLRAQAGNADNALLRAKYGRHWRSLIGTTPGRTGRHLITAVAATAALASGWVALTRGHWARAAAAAGLVWAGLTAEFAAGRILSGPRTAREISTVLVTSALIPPLAVAHRLRGELRVRLAGRKNARIPSGKPRAVLFDRDGTLIEDVPYLSDPHRVRPVPGARRTLKQLRRQGVAVGVIS
ncbi:MAG TPA: glycosyltransferase, partial [Propionibacteriaceae bacterium]|nr:glycosyltransferase [Propionibacteriaceae bacterium]